jgi:hypothetical protein
VSAPTFQQSGRRNLLAPVLVAFLLLGIVIALVVRYTPHNVADVSIEQVSVYPAHTVFKSDTILVGRDRSQDDLYVTVTTKVSDRLNLPIFLKDFTGTMTTADGEQIAATAAQKNDFENIYKSFPALQASSSTPLLRETIIDPGDIAKGMILLHFPVSSEVWNNRRSATLNIDLYHQGPLSVTLPQKIKASLPAESK